MVQFEPRRRQVFKPSAPPHLFSRLLRMQNKASFHQVLFSDSSHPSYSTLSFSTRSYRSITPNRSTYDVTSYMRHVCLATTSILRCRLLIQQYAQLAFNSELLRLVSLSMGLKWDKPMSIESNWIDSLPSAKHLTFLFDWVDQVGILYLSIDFDLSPYLRRSIIIYDCIYLDLPTLPTYMVLAWLFTFIQKDQNRAFREIK